MKQDIGQNIIWGMTKECYMTADAKSEDTSQPLHPGSLLCLFPYENTPIQIYCKFSDKNSDIFQISAQNIDYGNLLEPPRQGSSNKYPQSMFWAEIRKLMSNPVNLCFTT